VPSVEVEQAKEDMFRLRVQKHHLRYMDSEQFERTFGYTPEDDQQLKVAIETLDGLLSSPSTRL
ncbi:MAG: hypothetical protein AAGC73_04685, partial [Verrucomicrobiota bacterium]